MVMPRQCPWLPAVLIGLLALTTLTTHGANYIAVKTTDALNARSRLIARWFWLATIVLGVLGTIATFAVQPHITASFFARPWGFTFPIIALAGLLAMGYNCDRPVETGRRLKPAPQGNPPAICNTVVLIRRNKIYLSVV